MNILCSLGAHRWIQWGAARTTGLFRRCDRCQRREQGLEAGRGITWTPTQAANEEPAPGEEPAAGQHPDDLAVDRFAAALKVKLAESRSKGRSGWDNRMACSQFRLSQMLRDQVDRGDPLDVANFACFLWNRGETILPEQRAAPVRRIANG